LCVFFFFCEEEEKKKARRKKKNFDRCNNERTVNNDDLDDKTDQIAEKH